MPIYDSFKESETLKPLAEYVLVGPPSIILFWLTMSLFGIQRRKEFLWLLTYSCIFIGIPVVLYPLVEIDYFTYNSLVETLIYVIIG